MDGNRRWAKERGLPASEGHRAGYRAFKNVVRFAREKGISHLVAYLFSIENWRRDEKEVSSLLDLFLYAITTEVADMGKEGIRWKFVGDRQQFPPALQEAMSRTEKDTESNTGLTLWFCMSYSGRPEIVAATRAAVAAGEEITEESISRHLWTSGMPDPDLIIRTSGEQRLSGFLPWQSTYSELFFTKTLWPDFSPEEFGNVLAEYASRRRNFGI